MDRVTCAVPLHVPRPSGPWPGVRENLSRLGNALVCTTWSEWLPSVLTTRRLPQLLGADWPRYRRTPDAAVRYRFAASRLLIKNTAAAALAVPPEDLDLAYRLGGRPYLRGFDQIELSLSHTGDLIAVGLSRTGRIGVDVEPAERPVRLELLQTQVFTPAEARELASLPENERPGRALRLWTLKEAYSKALGQGLRLGFKEFGFIDGRLSTPDGSAVADGEWGFATYPVMDRYLLSVACHDAGLSTAGDTSAGTMLDQGFLAAMTDTAPR
ncbi:putative phosphopantetheinyl transferase [Streptomyces ambofaciens ATCC 23877]|uniref:Putative phosphopantetheinyl transferase n=2 Tax=Streptomyces ambofaciens TaxID=1889 RepID=Q1RQR3_STRA7|nr:4'-phosphopantetheinyl transferase superfamily protein [Streptomyces ambofaciens]AAR30158.1 putative 4'-phosphopantetheinyl transferase [Streptomyces ambofaciens ATCC 23877]AKZ53252.1 putative phosphopantetheinyl transferase [Streptomyces ambofaciens ATCC 23877]AKZ60511.1 putative phosphopantetheinyl transferase [Streptomyces ambofaciens ATCC 23877]CAI78102.1 putative phosphopantetheinyl transferase [Streptomyces ambofaciens ATCC 23877]CAI78376.1 putative phosphopantetheinyl transferase [St